jgi:hypothetical protein
LSQNLKDIYSLTASTADSIDSSEDEDGDLEDCVNKAKDQQLSASRHQPSSDQEHPG